MSENQDDWREITVGGRPVINYVLDPHAEKRARQRRVSDEDINKTLASYDTELQAEFGRRNRYKVIGSHRVRVTYHQEGDGTYYIWTVTKDEVSRS